MGHRIRRGMKNGIKKINKRKILEASKGLKELRALLACFIILKVVSHLFLSLALQWGEGLGFCLT